jgi:hypothetical protein
MFVVAAIDCIPYDAWEAGSFLRTYFFNLTLTKDMAVSNPKHIGSSDIKNMTA